MKSLEEQLYSYGKSDYYSFHMPGHKGQEISISGEPLLQLCEIVREVYKMDITEIDGFDNLHHPEGVIKALMEEMRAFYHTKKTYLSVNGSTAGILSCISACTNMGDSVLVARNCHKSVLNACFLRDLDVHYIMPEVIEECGIYGGISPENVDNLLKKHPLVKAVVIVSPTYEGVVSDVEGIAKIVHSYNIPLIVDEAHGAHFCFASAHSAFPKSAIRCGADAVIQSIHKTLPAMTQTALLHLNSERICADELERYLGIFQTTSPSYILMASASLCFHFMCSMGMERMETYEKRLLFLREELERLQFVKILSKKMVGKSAVFDYDIGKLVFLTEDMGCTGNQLMDRLRKEFHLELEMSAVGYAVAMTSVMDSEEGFVRLLAALQKIDVACCAQGDGTQKSSVQENVMRSDRPCKKRMREPFIQHIPVQRMRSAKAVTERGICRTYGDCEGHISKETLYVYPPGQAFLVAGEVIDRETLERIAWYEENGFEISGMKKRGCIVVVDQ